MSDNFDPKNPENNSNYDEEAGHDENIGNNTNNNESDFNTEKFYTDDDAYKESKINSFSHYSDYSSEENEEADMSKNPADDFFDKDARVYSDSMNSKDVERIVDKKIRKNKTPWWKFVITAIAGALLGAALILALGKGIDEANLAENPNSQQGQTVNITAAEEANVEIAVNEKCKDSVVGITTVVPTMNQFFQIESYAEGVGSGVIVSEDGYILTNSHVISDGKAENINVILSNQDSYEGELVWFEPEMDLAVVEIEASGLQPMELGDSDELVVGQKAIAIGNPLGMDLQSTLTSGYISGLDRSITMQNGMTMDGLIQTDAAINSGNSGGALINAEGELIGINTAKASADNIGFAIPINTAKVVIERIRSSDNFEPVTMGITAVDLEYFEGITGEESDVDDGLLVMEVVPGSDADDAGIEQGDIITQIDGVEVGSMGVLRTQLLAYMPGDSAELEIVRDNVSEKITITFSGERI